MQETQLSSLVSPHILYSLGLDVDSFVLSYPCFLASVNLEIYFVHSTQ